MSRRDQPFPTALDICLDAVDEVLFEAVKQFARNEALPSAKGAFGNNVEEAATLHRELGEALRKLLA